jgi:hypothetical protein
MSTTITVEGECHGFPGVVSTATLSKPEEAHDIPLKVSACTAIQNGRGYFFAYFVPEFLAESREPDLQRIINATDLFDLAPRAVAAEGPSFRPARPAREPSSGFLQNNQFGAIPPPAPTTPPTTTFSQRGVRTLPPPSPPPPPRPSPSPTPAIIFGANGSVEGAGPPHVNGVNKASDAANDAKARAYRQRVPW